MCGCAIPEKAIFLLATMDPRLQEHLSWLTLQNVRRTAKRMHLPQPKFRLCVTNAITLETVSRSRCIYSRWALQQAIL